MARGGVVPVTVLLWNGASDGVGWPRVVTSPGLPQIQTCAISASGLESFQAGTASACQTPTPASAAPSSGSVAPKREIDRSSGVTG